MDSASRAFQHVTLTGVPWWVGFLEIFVIGFLLTLAVRWLIEDRHEPYLERWLGFSVGSSVGLPLAGAFIANALHHTSLGNGETLGMLVVAVVLAYIGWKVGHWNAGNTAKATNRTLDIESEWYIAKVAWPLLFVALGVGYWLVLATHTSAEEKLRPLIGLAIWLSFIGVDKLRGN